MDWAAYTIDFTQEGRRKVNLFSYVLGYSRRQYHPLHRFAGLGDHAPRARAGLRAPSGRGRDLSLRQHEGRGGPLRGRRADLQHPLPGLRHALWLPAGGLSSAAAANEGQSGAAILVRRKEPAQRPRVPLPGTPQRSDRLVAGGSGRRARASADAAAAHRHARRRTPAPDPLARAALRGGGDGVSHRGRRGVHLLRARIATRCRGITWGKCFRCGSPTRP